jgi:uncharacterized protein YlxW (UPF0749 family)
MKRFRLSTLMLLIVIAALAIALVVQRRGGARREDELRSHIMKYVYVMERHEAEDLMLKDRVKELQAKLDKAFP